MKFIDVFVKLVKMLPLRSELLLQFLEAIWQSQLFRFVIVPFELGVNANKYDPDRKSEN